MAETAFIVSKAELLSFLRDNPVMALATSDGTRPAVSPIVFSIDDDLTLYILTYLTSLRAQYLLQNPSCSFTVWQYPRMSVQASGAAERITDDATIGRVMDSFADIATRDPNFWAPLFRIHTGDYCAFRIRPTWMRVLDLSHDTVRQQESPFYVIPL